MLHWQFRCSRRGFCRILQKSGDNSTVGWSFGRHGMIWLGHFSSVQQRVWHCCLLFFLEILQRRSHRFVSLQRSTKTISRLVTAFSHSMHPAMLHVHYHQPLNLNTGIKEFMRRNPRRIVSNQLFSDDAGTSGRPELDTRWLLKTWTGYIFVYQHISLFNSFPAFAILHRQKRFSLSYPISSSQMTMALPEDPNRTLCGSWKPEPGTFLPIITFLFNSFPAFAILHG